MSKPSRRVKFVPVFEKMTRERWERLKAQGALVPDWELFELMSSVAATPAKRTVVPVSPQAPSPPASAGSSCASCPFCGQPM